MSLRFPSAACYESQVQKEQFWLPKFAPLLPISIPNPLALGIPADFYPWHWSVYQWLEGENAGLKNISNLNQFARDLAKFLNALQAIDAAGGPLAGTHNFFRGGPLKTYDSQARQAIAARVEKNLMTKIWEEALATTWQVKPVWVHGDVSVGNLLVKNGELSAVIDFGCLGLGDPACDLIIAWTFFSPEGRKAFRDELNLDDATWARARGWALWKVLCAPNNLEVEKVINEILK